MLNDSDFLNEFHPAYGVPGLLINRLGAMKCALTGREIMPVYPTSSHSHYPTYSYKKHKSVLHRLVAATFLERSDDKPIVNHLDGNKLNFRWDNLEWTTYSGNSQHAYDTGLRDENTPVLVKDLRTQEVMRFNSYGKTAAYFNCDPSKILHLLKPHRRGKIFHRFYVIIKEGDVWPDLDMVNIGRNINGESKQVVAMRQDDPTLYIFRSVGDAGRYIGVYPGALGARLRRALRKHKYITQMRGWTLAFRETDTLKGVERIMGHVERSKNRAPRKAIPIKVTDLLTGQVRQVESCRLLAQELGITKGRLQTAINRNDGVFKRKGTMLKVEYKAPLSVMANG